MICRGTDESLKVLKERSENVVEAILCNAFNAGWDEASKSLSDSMMQAVAAINSGTDLDEIPYESNPFIDVVKMYISSTKEMQEAERE